MPGFISRDENVAIILKGKKIRVECVEDDYVFQELNVGILELGCFSGKLKNSVIF